MPEAKLRPSIEPLSGLSKIAPQDENEPKHVKIIVFDDQNRVLTVKSGNRFILPGGRIEWDDDDAEAAARREVFESANIALGIVKPVTIIKTKDRDGQIAQTIVFVGRLVGEGRISEQRPNNRFMNKETFFETIGGQSPLVRSLVETAHRSLVSEEIKDEHRDAARISREKYCISSLILRSKNDYTPTQRKTD